MTRLMLMTFFGEKRWEPEVDPHESPKVMTIPLIVLAALSIVGGLLILNDWIVDFLSPVVGTPPPEDPLMPALVVSVIAVLVGGRRRGHRVDAVRPAGGAREAPTKVSVFTTAGRNELYGDAFNDAIIIGPSEEITEGLVAFDRGVVDGGFVGTGAALAGLSGRLRLAQNGFVRSYALSILGGAALVLLALLVVNLT